MYFEYAAHDFSANVNPYGTPEPVRDAIVAAADCCAAYPDPYCTLLRARLARHEGIDADMILCANGAAELIYQFAYALDVRRPALIVSPAFIEYEAALRAADIPFERVYLKAASGFVPDDGLLALDFARYSAVFLCTPNNPTGVTVSARLLGRLAARCMEAGTRLFCDLCFLNLSDTPDMYAVPQLLADFPRLFLLRAFTKSYGMAGVRLGYMMSGDREFLARMSKKVQCWNVSTLAQAAGCAALDCGAWLSDTRAKIIAERGRLSGALEKMDLTVYRSEANYLLIYSKVPLAELLHVRGILVRDCANYAGLKRGYIRIGVRQPEENDLLIGAVREICGSFCGNQEKEKSS